MLLRYCNHLPLTVSQKLSVSFVFFCHIKKVQRTMALLFFPHCFQGTGTCPFHNSHLVPRQFLDTCT